MLPICHYMKSIDAQPLHAVHDRPVRPRSRFARPGAAFRFFVVIALVLTIASTATLHFRLGFFWLGSYLACINLVTSLAYAYDKLAARQNLLRIPEKLLHFLAAIGGSPAAFASQRLLRHKTIKPVFRYWFWGIVIMQALLVAGWIWYR